MLVVALAGAQRSLLHVVCLYSPTQAWPMMWRECWGLTVLGKRGHYQNNIMTPNIFTFGGGGAVVFDVRPMLPNSM